VREDSDSDSDNVFLDQNISKLWSSVGIVYSQEEWHVWYIHYSQWYTNHVMCVWGLGLRKNYKRIRLKQNKQNRSLCDFEFSFDKTLNLELIMWS